MLFRAMMGLAIAMYVASPGQLVHFFETPAVSGLRAQIEATHPWQHLQAQLRAIKF
jgi:hypothetical protein